MAPLEGELSRREPRLRGSAFSPRKGVAESEIMLSDVRKFSILPAAKLVQRSSWNPSGPAGHLPFQGRHTVLAFCTKGAHL